MRVGQVFAVPCQQIIRTTQGRGGQMDRIREHRLRQRSRAQEAARQRLNFP